jgi:hypothetical protein
MHFAFHHETDSRDMLDCISLWQPWASWVAWGWKPIETRTHARLQTLAGRRIVIHAAKRWDDNALRIASPYMSAERIADAQRRHYARGAFVATVLVVDHRALVAADSPRALIDCETVKRFGLELSDVRELRPPIAGRGRQSVWQIPASLLSTAP